MKIHSTFVYLLVTFVYVSAIEFKLTKNGNTCVLFTAANNSQIKIRSNVNSTVQTFNFDAATVDQTKSDCTTPQLWINFPSSVVGKFLFSKIPNDATSVNILVQFRPNQVFPGDSNTGIQSADDVGNQMTQPHLQSYQCNTEESIQFNMPDNYTVEMMVSGVRLQAFDVQNGQFSNASICAADAPTTQPTTKPTTQPTTTENPTTENSNGTTSSSNITEPTTQSSNTTTEQTTQPANVTTASPTTPVITTTATPTPPVNTFRLKNGNDTCIVFEAAVSFDITYDTKDKKTAVATINLPNATLVDQAGSSCEYTTDSQRLSLDFFNNWKLSMVFGLEKSSSMLAKNKDDKYSLQTVSLIYVIDENRFPNAANPGTQMNVTTKMPDNTLEATGNYKCQKDTSLTLNDTTTNHPISMKTQNLQYQAFNTGNFTGFDDSNTTECPSDTETNSIVPIAVGAALAGLVIIVLIAYLIGRKRSRGGYEQV